MAISKITLNGVTQMDLTQDTVTINTLKSPYTAHDAAGQPIIGVYDVAQYTLTMISGASSATTSSTYSNEVYYLATLQVIGTFTSAKIYLEGRCNSSGSWVSLAFIDLEDETLIDGATGITAKGIYSVGIAGINEFRVRVASISGGNVTVTSVFTR